MLRSLLEAVHDLIFPPHCLSCERRLDLSRPPLLCLDCLDEVRCIHPPWCTCCGIPFPAGESHLCKDCLQRSFHFDLARSAFRYGPPISDLLLSLKFSGNTTVLASLRELTAQSGIISELSVPDLILPVPLHTKRLRKRMFNQATVLARSCFPAWRHRIEPMLLTRTIHTASQSLLTGRQRRRNLSKAFEVSVPHQIAGKTILLVDDVHTTGSTVNECAGVLHRAGARRIEVFTFARSLVG